MIRTTRFSLLLVGLSSCTMAETAPTRGRTGAAVDPDPVVVDAKRPAPKFVDIVEYQLPTPNAFPHDPAVDPDGALWFTEQKANKIGELDVASGKFREFSLKTRDSGPHGITVAPDGTVWFTAAGKGYIGELDPQTSAVTEHPMPDGKASDPHTPVLAPDGVLWFTAEQSNFVGKLDTRNGRVEVVQVPTSDARPYGMVIGPDGAPYFCEFGTNKLGTIEPVTMAIREFTLPEGARPRRIALALDGTLYFSDFARGRIGHFVPSTGQVEMSASPGGPDSRPYAIATTADGAVWYVETGKNPNELVRYEPDDKSFRSEAIPSGGGVVRNMVATPSGELYLAESGVNRVAVAKPRASVAAR